MKATSRELDWIVNEETDIKIKILDEEEKNNTRYVEVEFEYKNEKCFISYRYQMEYGITFPEDIIKMKNIMIVKKEDSNLLLELKNEKEYNKKEGEVSKEEKKDRIKEEYDSIEFYKDIKDIKLEKDDTKEMKKIIKKSNNILDISRGIMRYAIKYEVRANVLYGLMLKELNII